MLEVRAAPRYMTVPVVGGETALCKRPARHSRRKSTLGAPPWAPCCGATGNKGTPQTRQTMSQLAGVVDGPPAVCEAPAAEAGNRDTRSAVPRPKSAKSPAPGLAFLRLSRCRPWKLAVEAGWGCDEERAATEAQAAQPETGMGLAVPTPDCGWWPSTIPRKSGPEGPASFHSQNLHCLG